MVDKQPTKKQIQERKPELDVMSEKEYVHQVEIYCSESKKHLKDDINPRIRKLNDTRRTFLLPKKSKGYLYVLSELVNGKIKLVTSTEGYEELQGKFKNKRGDGTVIFNEFRLNLSDNKQLYIAGSYDSKTAIENGDIRLSINYNQLKLVI